ncbi:hypothetical protein L6V77_08440 [Myxococcota bacterium]|nr:hypothetical protein [Myxococcota bacterium]
MKSFTSPLGRGIVLSMPLLAGQCLPARADGTAHPAPAVVPSASAPAEHPADDHGPHAHHLAAFAGATTTAHETAPSAGADYFYYLPVLDRRLGVGPIVDATFGQHVEIVAGLALAARSHAGLQLAAAPIVVLVEGERTFGGRLNVNYGYHLTASISVGPSVSADFLPHDTLYVYGLSGGLGF